MCFAARMREGNVHCNKDDIFNKEEIPSRFLRSSDEYIRVILPFIVLQICKSNKSHILPKVYCLLS